MLFLNGSTKKQEPTLLKDTYTWHAGQASKNLGDPGLAHTLETAGRACLLQTHPGRAWLLRTHPGRAWLLRTLGSCSQNRAGYDFVLFYVYKMISWA